MSLLSAGIDLLTATAPTAAGGSIVVTRGTGLSAVSSTPIPAIYCRAVSSVDDTGQARVEIGNRDFMITAADYRLAGLVVDPARGDTIAADGKTYEVRATGNDPCAHSCDPAGVKIRIHTKEVNRT